MSGGVISPPFFVCPLIAMFPFGEHIIKYENYRMEGALFVRRKASGDEGAAPSMENIG
jgi:hypothetical protein